MNRWWIPALVAVAVLQGCASAQRGAIPVVDSSSRVSNGERVSASRNTASRTGTPQAQSIPEDSGVTVTVPAGAGSEPIQTFAAPASSAPLGTGPIDTSPVGTPPSTQGGYDTGVSGAPVSQVPTGIPSTSGGLSADEQLDGPVLALLTTAQQQQAGGDLNGASSNLERAQRVAPREPQVLYRLAQVRLAQGDAAQAEQLAQRGLGYASGRSSLQASLWGIIAQAREKQGNTAGAAEARQKAGIGG